MIMELKAVKYNSREEALGAFKKMVQRKREWLAETDRELKQMRESSKAVYANG